MQPALKNQVIQAHFNANNDSAIVGPSLRGHRLLFLPIMLQLVTFIAVSGTAFITSYTSHSYLLVLVFT